MARVVGISLRAVKRIWAAHRFHPHRLRTFKRSRDPAFAAKVEDVVGLYMDPPARAVVLSIAEKSQIRALVTPATVARVSEALVGLRAAKEVQIYTPMARKGRGAWAATGAM